MASLRMILLLILTILMAGCATPPGKLTESDFVSKEVSLDLSISKAYNQLREGLRYCGPESGGIVFVTHHGVPECMPFQEDGSALCDLYIGYMGGGRSGVVLGRIELKPLGKGTIAVLRVRDYAANQETILKAWEQFLLGRAKEVCP